MSAEFFHGAAFQDMLNQYTNGGQANLAAERALSAQERATRYAEAVAQLKQQNAELTQQNHELLRELNAERGLTGHLLEIPMQFLQDLDRAYPGTDVLRMLSGKDNKFIREEYRKRHQEVARDNPEMAFEDLENAALQHCREIFAKRMRSRNQGGPSKDV